MEDPLSRFRQLRQGMIAQEKSDHTNEADTGYVGILPPETTQIVTKITGDVEERLREIGASYNIPALPSEFQDIPTLRTEITSKDDIDDKYFANRTALVLKRLTISDTVTLGRSFIKSLTSGVSQYSVGTIFALAFQLKTAGIGNTRYALPTSDELTVISDISLDALDKSVLEAHGDPSDPVESPVAEAQLAQAYAYIATSTLKMFTRSPENYEKSWNHIIDGYRKFYYVPFPISGIQPQTAVIKEIHGHFSLSEMFRATLYRYLYNANNAGTVSGLQRYLYDIQISHTGMHVVPIAYKICTSMNCTPENLIRVINAKRFRPQIMSLISAFELMKTSDENHKRQMWKYGRIFDSSFLASLQTRACPRFVYILACILKRENPKSAASVLEIKQLEEVNAEDRHELWLGSKILVEAINHLTLRQGRKSPHQDRLRFGDSV